jgi:hypothetical protein
MSSADGAVPRHPAFIAFIAEHTGDQFANIAFIIDDQDIERHSVHLYHNYSAASEERSPETSGSRAKRMVTHGPIWFASGKSHLAAMFLDDLLDDREAQGQSPSRALSHKVRQSVRGPAAGRCRCR